MCSVRTKGSSGERISLSSSRSRSLLFTPRLFTLCAVPLNRFGSGEHTKTHRVSYTVTHKYLSWKKWWPNFSSPHYRLDKDGWEGVCFQRISSITMQLHWLLLCPWARNLSSTIPGMLHCNGPWITIYTSDSKLGSCVRLLMTKRRCIFALLFPFRMCSGGKAIKDRVCGLAPAINI